MLTGVKDLDYKIMNNLDDKDIVNLCKVNKKSKEYFNDQKFWMSRTFQKYSEVPPDILNKYKGSQAWSDYYIDQLRNIEYSANALEGAMCGGRMDEVIILLTAGYRPRSRRIAICLIYNNLDMIQYFIDNNIPIDINLGLTSAARDGFIEKVKYFVENGADVNYSEGDPLYKAAVNNHLDVVKYLVEHGADISVNNYNSIMFAYRYNFKDIVDYLISQGAPDPQTL